MAVLCSGEVTTHREEMSGCEKLCQMGGVKRNERERERELFG